jgi:hypothetical protein
MVLAAAAPYEGYWKGTSNQGHLSEIFVQGSQSAFTIKLAVGSGSCARMVTTEHQPTVTWSPDNQTECFEVSSSTLYVDEVYDGCYNSTDDRWEGNWSYAISQPGCLWDDNGTWTANPQPQIVVSPSTYETLDVVDAFDCPGSFPKGLTYDGLYLWYADAAEDKIYQMSTAGSVQSSFTLPLNSSPTGLTWDGATLWIADDSSATITNTDGSGTILAPPLSAEGNRPQGLAWGNSHLWNVDLMTGAIYEMDGATVLTTIATSADYPTGLAHDGTYLWLADATHQHIHKIVSSGTVVRTYDAPAAFPQGLTFDGTHLWNADSDTGRIYRLKEQKADIDTGFSELRTFSLINNGASPLTISSITIDGVDAAAFMVSNEQCVGHSLLTFETCDITLRFAPATSGEKSATATVYSSDPQTPAWTIPLTGQGVACTQAPIKIEEEGYWDPLQAVYDNPAIVMDGDTIKLHAADEMSNKYSGNLTLNRPVNIEITGGYDCMFTTTANKPSYIRGTLIIANGTLIPVGLGIGSSVN